MATDRATVAAVVLLALSIGLLANPLYLTQPDRGSQLMDVQPVSPAEGAAERTAVVAETDRLPVLARHAAKRSLPGGSFALNATGPPLIVRLLETQWRYVGIEDPDTVYRPTVEVGANASTVTFEPVPIEDAERELGVTPPESLQEENHLKEVVWFAEQHPNVVFVGEFDEPWEQRLIDGINADEWTVPHGDDARSLAPLGDGVRFVVQDDVAYRATVTESDGAVVLETPRVADETLLAEANVTIVEPDELSAGTSAVLLEAIESENGYVQFHGDEADPEELERLSEGLVRHEGRYYVVQLGHGDDFSLVPLFRVILWAVGGLVGFVGLFVLYRARGWDE